MKKYLRHSANVVTGLALSLGVFSIVNAVRGFHQAAAILILSAAVLDVMDGWVARVTNGVSRFGTVLDSISDFVSFCIAPAVLLYAWGLFERGALGGVASGFLAVCGGLRLVRFVHQSDTVEKTAFTGLPTPAAAVIVASGVWACTERSLPVPGAVPAGVCLAFLLGVLMVSQVPYGSAKALLSSGRTGRLLALLAGAVFLFVVGRYTALALFAGAILYMSSGPITGFLGYVSARRGGEAR